MKKPPARQFTPEERVKREEIVRKERHINKDSSYYHSAYEIKFDW